MIRTSMSTCHRSRARRRKQAGFTMVELLVVVVVIAILIGLLVPVITGALRTAKNAATSSEINQLAQALASFKSKYGDYPPSRILLCETGVYPVGNTQPIGPGDITLGALAQRSLIAMRKFFPRVVFSTGGNQAPPTTATFWYDFNGNGIGNGAVKESYILQGHECLAFFLGGIPFQDPKSGTFGMTGFGKDPVNPFTNALVADPNYGGNSNPMYSANRQPPMFEFNPSRLFLDPNNPSPGYGFGLSTPGIPGYYDNQGNSPPSLAGTTLNFYVYFSGYGNGVYDANDVNFLAEADGNGAGPIGLQYTHAGAVYPSVSPNPYTTSATVAASGTVNYEKAQTFQIFSAGADGLYGVGGQFVDPSSGSSSAVNTLPFDPNNTFAGFTGNVPNPTTDGTIRRREGDNLTNFSSGKLQ
jgi:prepilin-type N-terminal cleavage/methylation domain-containing protein